uniref:Serpin domain-containing protein n=1 Tax=Setaria digitata TaxID=48799 RepID=A0A915PE48_9BILA
MSSRLGANEYEVRLYFAKLLAITDNVRNENYTLTIANRFYLRKDSSAKESFSRILQYYYEEELRNFEFAKKKQLVKA